MPVLWTSLLHFLVVENRAVYLFYGSFKSLAGKIAVAAELKREFGHDMALQGDACIHDAVLHERVQCVRKAVARALWEVWLEAGYHHACYRHGEAGLSYIGILHLAVAIMCGIFVSVGVVGLCRSGANDWRQGKYLQFTWQLAHQRAHKMAGGCVFLFTLVTVGISLAEAFSHGETEFLNPAELFQLGWMDMLGLLSSALAFHYTHDPAFDWRSKLMSDAMFVRPWLDLVKQSNDAFGQKLDHAILKARLGEPGELEDLVGHDLDHPVCKIAGTDSTRELGIDVTKLADPSAKLLDPSEITRPLVDCCSSPSQATR